MIGVLLSLMLGGGLQRYLPCTPGLTVTYADAAGRAVEEEVLGFGVAVEPRVCAVERRLGAARERLGREYLSDRISDAGWLDTPLALRAPILKAPLTVGARWHWNREDHQVIAIGRVVEVPAGRFVDTVWITSRSSDGQREATAVYAAGVGLVRYQSEGRQLSATRVRGP
jgi:hypothetical protein